MPPADRRGGAAGVRRVSARSPGSGRSGARAVEASPRLLGISLPLLIAGEVAVGIVSLAALGGTLTAKRVRATRSARVRALRAAPLPARRGQAAGPRGHDGGDRQRRARLPRRARTIRPAVSRLRTAPRHRTLRGARVVARRALRAARRRRTRRRDQRRLPRRAARAPTRRDAPTARRELPRAAARHALHQAAQLRLPARGLRRRTRLAAARGHRARPGRRRHALRDPLSAHARACASSRDWHAPSTAATRTGSCARSAGGCPRAG